MFGTKNRRRLTLDCSSPKITDPSYQKMCDINNIIAQYQKTGMFPNYPQKVARYINCEDVPSLETAHEAVNLARQAFYELPATLRKLMDNNPANLPSFLSDPENRDLCIKHGLINPPEKEIVQVIPDNTDPDSTTTDND